MPPRRSIFLRATWAARLVALFVLGGVGIPVGSASADGRMKAEPLVIGETFTLDSKALGETRRINVYLPAGYAANPNMHLPVLYMPDGGLAEDFLHVAGLVEVLVGDESMRPFILVGIENTQRRRDLTGPTNNPSDRKIAPQVGGSAAFRKFIREELMPEVAARYRTTRETAIVGESLAGLFAVETFFVEPELFDTYIAIDPSLWWNNRELIKAADERLRAWTKGEKTLYVATGGDSGLDEIARPLAEVFERDAPRSVHWYYEAMPAETHATIYHPAALRAFRLIFKPLPLP